MLKLRCILLFSFVTAYFVLISAKESTNFNNEKRVDVSRVIIKHIHHVRKNLEPFEPLKLEDQHVEHLGWLRNGFLDNFSLVNVTGNSIVTYLNKKLCLDLNVGWTEIEYLFEYDFKILFHSETGILDGQLSKLNVNIGLCADFVNYRLSFENFKITEFGNVDVKLSGSWFSKIIEYIGKLLIKLNKGNISNAIQNQVIQLCQKFVDDLNKLIDSHKNKKQFLYRLIL